MAKRLLYAEEEMQRAIDAVRAGASQRAACKRFGVPRGTLQDKLAGRVPEGRFIGAPTVLTLEEEGIIEKWLLDLSMAGFPRKKVDVINTVEKITIDKARPNPFKDNRPGETWYRNFLSRHPKLSTRTAETINKGRACVSETAIRNWFGGLESFLQSSHHLDILLDGRRIINADETNFQLCPKSGKVLGPKGWKNIYEIVPGKEKETLTVLGTFNADGDVIKGMIVYPYKRPPKDVVESVPGNWAIGLSESGWMKSETFYEYVANVLHPWLLEQEVQLPVLFVVDGHKTHLTYQLSEFCSTHGIILYCLLPNATHILQPADVSVFRPLKVQWKKCVRDWQIENIGKSLSRSSFAPLLEKAMSTISRTAIQNGFKACGLFPFNPDAVDYTKCVSKPLPQPSKEVSRSHTETEWVQQCRIALSVINKLVSDGHNRSLDTIIDALAAVTDSSVEIASPEAETAAIGTGLTHSGDDNEPVTSNTNTSTEDGDICGDEFGELEIGLSTDSESITEIALATLIDAETFQGELRDVDCRHSSTTESMDNTPSSAEGDVESLLRQVSTNVSSSVLNQSPPGPAFAKHLFWPVRETVSKKISKPKFPYAVSSEEWKRRYQEQERAKEEKERAKENRKKEREAKKLPKNSVKQNRPKKLPCISSRLSVDIPCKTTPVTQTSETLSQPAHAVTQSCHTVTQPCGDVTQLTPTVTQSSPAVTQPSPVTQPSSIIQSTPSVSQLTPTVTQSAHSVSLSTPVTQSIPVTQSTHNVTQSTHNVTQSTPVTKSAQTVTQSTPAVDRSTAVAKPTPVVTQSTPAVDRSTAGAKPTPVVTQSTPAVDRSTAVAKPTPVVTQPTLTVAQPSSSVCRSPAPDASCASDVCVQRQTKKRQTAGKTQPKAKKVKCVNTEDTPCLYCGSLFSESKPGEQWICCNRCTLWAHESCSDVSRDGTFTCEICKDLPSP